MADSWENDIHLIHGFLLQHRDLPEPIQDAVARLIACEYAEAIEVEEEEIEEELPPQPEPKKKRTSNMSPENREAAARRMREFQARKRAEREGLEYKPESEPEGNVEAPSSQNGAESEPR
jgi:hypothetical protein